MDWLGFVQSSSTRSKIKQWFKKNRSDEYIKYGQSIASESLTKSTYEEFLKTGVLRKLSEQMGLNSENEIFFRIGTGEISGKQLIGRLKNLGYLQKEVIEEEKESTIEEIQKPIRTKKFAKGSVAELKSFVHTFAKCCQPIPKEDIKGVISVGRGIVIHRTDCLNIQNLDNKRLIDISWDGTDESTQKFAVTLDIEFIDRIGITRDILDKIANEKINVLDVRGSRKTNKQIALLKISVEISGYECMHKLIKTISDMSDVIHVQRYSAPISKRGKK